MATVTETSIPHDIENSKDETQSSVATITSSANSSELPQNPGDAVTLKDSIHLSEMESSLESNNFPADEIPEPIKVLDSIISEFEESSKPAVAVSAENQSEDDGYMSLSRKNMRKEDSEDTSLTSLNRNSVEMTNKTFNDKQNGDMGSSNENVKADLEETSITDQNPIQTTLPKTQRSTTTNTTQSNYSSLPCCSARTSSSLGREFGSKQIRTGSCNGERNVLGIDISAVHKAVLRGGVAKLPEPILNEHPVTIYPGRYSPPIDGIRIGNINNRPQRLLNSVEKHKEMCHILKPLSSKSSSSSTSPHSTSGSLASKSQDCPDTKLKKSSNNKAKGFNGLKSNYDESEDDDLDDFSEDSVDGEQSSLSMSAELTEKPVMSKKQASIAWEIHFNSERKRSKPQGSGSRSAARKPQKKQSSSSYGFRANEKPFGIAYSNAIYSLEPEEEYANNVYPVGDFKVYESKLDYYAQNSNMLGKGTFVIRRSASNKKPPKAADVFRISPPNHPPNDLSTYQSIACISPPPFQRESCKLDELSFISNGNQQKSSDYKFSQRGSLPSSRDRLSLNIEGHSTQHNSLKKDKDCQSRTLPNSCVKTPSDDLPKFQKASLLQSDASHHSSELINQQDNIISDYEASNIFGGYKCSTDRGNGGEYPSGKILDMHSNSNSTTPHTDLAPTIEEDEEQYSDLSYSAAAPAATSSAPRLKQIENNISALLRGDIAVARAGEVAPPMRSLEFRPGVHKSESAKEMLLSQSAGFGPLPPSPPPPIISSSKQSLYDYDALPLPPLPPSPAAESTEGDDENDDELGMRKSSFLIRTTSVEVHRSNNGLIDEKPCGSRNRSVDRRDRSDRDRDWSREKKRGTVRQMSDDLPLPPTVPIFEQLPPEVPPHRGHSANTMKSWSIDSNYRRRSPKVIGGSMVCYGSGGGGGGGSGGSGITTPTGTQHGAISNDTLGVGGGSGYTSKRYLSYGTKRSCKQSPRDEHRGSLQTSCSLPETPIFARGCDIPRTPFRRNNENAPAASGSRTAPRSSTSHNINMGTSVVGIGSVNTYGAPTSMCRQRSISHALASNEMLRMSGMPQRGWYPKQRTMRPASTENIDRLTSIRVYDCGTSNIGAHSNAGSRKPLTLPPNLTPSFLNKSPREALRRVTSLLITKKKNTKERKSRPYYEDTVDGTISYETNTCLSSKDTKRDSNCNNSSLPKAPKPPKKKGLFKNLWKKTKHFSLDQ